MHLSVIRKDIENCNNIIIQAIEKLKNDKDIVVFYHSILKTLRDLYEAAASYIYFSNPNNNFTEKKIDNSKKAIKFIKDKGEYRYIYNFHDKLNKYVAHNTLNDHDTKRLLLNYIENLFILKNKLLLNYNIEIIENIGDLINLYDKSNENYEGLHNLISNSDIQDAIKHNFSNGFYVQSQKPIFDNGNLFYEITLNYANVKSSKYDKIVVFSEEKLPKNFVIKLWLIETKFKKIPGILIVKHWEIFLRSYELKKFVSIFKGVEDLKGKNIEIISTKDRVYLQEYFKKNKINLLDFILNEKHIEKVSNYINAYSLFFDSLKNSKELILKNESGSNILRYLLCYFIPRVLNNELFFSKQNLRISNLYLQNGCIPFDDMPFALNLKGCKTNLMDLLKCIPKENRDHEFLFRKLDTISNYENRIYFKKEELNFENIEFLAEKFNEKLYSSMKNLSICVEKNIVFIREKEENFTNFYNKLKERDINFSYINDFKKNDSNFDDIDNEKKQIIEKIFKTANYHFIYGSAGTGKTKIIECISKVFENYNKLFLTHTNIALNNLKRRISNKNCNFMTVEKFLFENKKNSNLLKTELLIIDECSFVSNNQIINVLNCYDYPFILFVGDSAQIKSIEFGNWFILSERIFSNNKDLLKNNYRVDSKNLHLLNYWKSVRNKEDDIIEKSIKLNSSLKINDFFNQKLMANEIILALKYNGLYGINNLNSILQNMNENESFYINSKKYKINDPITFVNNDFNLNYIPNNIMGKIEKISRGEDCHFFEISVNEFSINSFSFNNNELFKILENGNLQIQILDSIDENDIFDDYYEKTTVPFQISYAMSVHRAQGLEFDSVKFVIDNSDDDFLNHDIFYTAITRTKDKLKIFWDMEIEKKIIQNFIHESKNNQDYQILKGKLKF